ncbi:MAG: hypothetical protein ACOC82_03930, partial [Candidatus Bipolaricaulota bacterium]
PTAAPAHFGDIAVRLAEQNSTQTGCIDTRQRVPTQTPNQQKIARQELGTEYAVFLQVAEEQLGLP